MKRNLLVLVSLGLVCIAMLSACGSTAGYSQTSGSTPIQVVDGLGREIALESPARRIVSLAASTTEMLYEIDALEWLVGRDEFSDEPPSVLDLPSVGGGWGDLNNELILTLEPDLVLAAEIHTPEQVQALEDLGLTVFWFPNFLSFDGLYTNLENLGKLTGQEAVAQDRIAALRDRVEAVEALMTDVEPIATYYEVDGSEPNAPWTTGSETFHDVLITMAGGVNIASEIQGWGQISQEAILAADPEVILFASGPFVSSTVESIAGRAGWEEITAVTNGAIYNVDTNIIDRPGPRLVLALEIFAEHIHPELFE